MSDISYDKTEEDLCSTFLRSGREWKRPSAPPEDLEMSPPRRKSHVRMVDTCVCVCDFPSDTNF